MGVLGGFRFPSLDSTLVTDYALLRVPARCYRRGPVRFVVLACGSGRHPAFTLVVRAWVVRPCDGCVAGDWPVGWVGAASLVRGALWGRGGLCGALFAFGLISRTTSFARAPVGVSLGCDK